MVSQGKIRVLDPEGGKTDTGQVKMTQPSLELESQVPSPSLNWD